MDNKETVLANLAASLLGSASITRPVGVAYDATSAAGGSDEGGSDEGAGDENTGSSEEDTGASGNPGEGETRSVDELLAEIQSLRDEKANLVKDVMKKKTSAKTAAQEAKDAKGQLDAINSQLSELFGDEVTLEDLQSRIAERKAAEVEQLRRNGEFDTLRDRMTSEHQRELDALKADLTAKLEEANTALTSANSEIHRLLVTNSFAGSRFINDELTLTPGMAEKVFGEHFKVEVADDGRRTLASYNMAGQPIVDAKGHAKSFDDALREIIAGSSDADRLFRNKANPGAGSSTEDSGSKEPPKAAPRGVAAISAGLNAQKN